MSTLLLIFQVKSYYILFPNKEDDNEQESVLPHKTFVLYISIPIESI